MPCRNPLDHSPHEYLADSDAIGLSPCPGKGIRMPETVMHKHSGKTAEIIGEFGDCYWLNDPNDTGRPWTSSKSQWGPPMPKVGDVWVSAATEYRVLGVDEDRKMYLIVPKADYAGGDWPNPHEVNERGIKGIQVDALAAFEVVYVRVLPEVGLELKERPEDW